MLWLHYYRFILGNTADHDSGFVIYQPTPTQCRIRVEFRTINLRQYKDFYCVFDEWTMYTVGYHSVMEGGYERMVKDSQSKTHLDVTPTAWFIPTTFDMSGNPYNFNANSLLTLGWYMY